MRAFIVAAIAALLTLTGFHPTLAQQQPGPAAIEQAPIAPPGGVPQGVQQGVQQDSVQQGPSDIQIEWEVRSRFRLFRREADFQRHVTALRAGSELAAEHQLEQGTDGRGWAKDIVDYLCVDAAGAWLDTCERDGERENYLVPQSHPVTIRLTGAVPPGSTCNWSFDDGTIPPQVMNGACSDAVQTRLRYGRPTIAAVGVTRPDNTVDAISTEIQVRDFLIAGLGDSVAAGEGNPDKPIELADEGFCFKRFLGAARSEYFRPSREGYDESKACDDYAGGPGAAATADWRRHGARWISAACHRSLYSYQMRTALALAVENRHAAVTFLPLACSGATIANGLFGSQGASECPLKGRCAGKVAPQLEQLRDVLERARKLNPARGLDLVLLTIGANDIRFSGLVADVIINAGVERVLFNRGGLIATVPQAQAALDRDLPAGFAKLRAALKPMVGGNLSRVVFVSYGHPALNGGEPCPGGRDGLDVHPAFNANGERLRHVTDFVLDRFLPRLKELAGCEGVPKCVSDADRMTFVDAHQAAFADHGICVRAATDPPFDRECFRSDGKSFEDDPVAAASSPLTCSMRPSEFRPYAPRARWIRTANDSYFTAMTYPEALPALMQPSDIHDATWGALSALYGGAFHPSAEGHAAMADAALPAAREALGLKAPPEVIAQPLPPPPGAAAR